MSATAKHYAVHSQPEGGRNVAPGNYSRRVIMENFLLPFETAVKEGHVSCLMASYNEIDGIPSHANGRGCYVMFFEKIMGTFRLRYW